MFARIFSSAKIYCDRRMMVMVALGFSSGFPFPLVFNTLSLWLESAGLSLALIGIFSLAKVPYSFKWVWAPLVDKICLPFLGRLGRRRSWALLTQIFLMISILGMAFSNPGVNPRLIALMALILAFASSSQDIVLDAYRIESFKTDEQAAGSAMFVLGYRLGFIFSGAGALFLAEVMSWNHVYMIMSSAAIIGIATILSIREPGKPSDETCLKQDTTRPIVQRINHFFQKAVIAPFANFMTRPGWKLILLFIFLYRMSDAYIGPMTYIFYKNIGFDYAQIASVTKLYGTVATIAGMFIGGIVLNRVSMTKGLILCGILQGLSNLIYVAQAYAGNNIYMLVLTISVENITGGMGTAAFVAYISSLCNIQYTATQYALLSSLMSLARDVFAATSGILAQTAGWSLFFILTTVMAVPGIALLVYMTRKYPPSNIKNRS